VIPPARSRYRAPAGPPTAKSSAQYQTPSINPGLEMRNYCQALRLGHTAVSARFTYLGLLDFRGGLLDHLNGGGINYWNDRLFYFPRDFLHRRALGVGPGNRPFRRRRLRYLARLAAFG